MLVSVLASGSKGNSTLITTDRVKILIDAGKNQKYLETALNQINLSLKDIDYILITHTHADHTSALKTIVKSHKPTIVLTELMYKDLDYLKNYENILLLTDNLELEDLVIENIKTSHDTSDSRGYIVTQGNSSVVQITDTGYLNQKYFKKLQNKTIYIFESNHNIEMLMHGRYPKWLKARVSSDVGHLSNESSAFYLTKLIGENTKEIILAHLSEENNTPELALETLNKEFVENNIKFNNIVVAKQEERTDLIEV
ncbi:MAG: MBL fold metallo-hydrolase [Bacilli bacterium]